MGYILISLNSILIGILYVVPLFFVVVIGSIFSTHLVFFLWHASHSIAIVLEMNCYAYLFIYLLIYSLHDTTALEMPWPPSNDNFFF